MHSNRKTLLIVAGFAVMIVVAIALVDCRRSGEDDRAESKSTKVRIAYLPIIPDLPIFVANDQGFFEEQGLDPVMTKVSGSGNQVIETLARGDADFAYLAYSTILQAEQQAPGSFVVLHHNVDSKAHPGLYALVAKDGAGIESAADLRGKKIGTFPGSAMLVLTKLMITTGSTMC